MTILKPRNKPGSNSLQNRLGGAVYNFLDKAKNNDKFLLDYERIKGKCTSGNWQINDYSPILLPLVKYYENSLWFICDKLGIFNQINDGKKPHSLRAFFDTKETEINIWLSSKINDNLKYKKLSRKLFSTIDDYVQRNEVVHCNEIISFPDLSNYDSLLTKLKELVELLFNHNLLQKN